MMICIMMIFRRLVTTDQRPNAQNLQNVLIFLAPEHVVVKKPHSKKRSLKQSHDCASGKHAKYYRYSPTQSRNSLKILFLKIFLLTCQVI